MILWIVIDPVDSAIHLINPHPEDRAISYHNTHPLDSNLSVVSAVLCLRNFVVE